MQRKKSRFWLFIFSFMPGAGEMYMGFMKMGVSLMFGFWASALFVSFFNLSFLAVFPVVLYFYSFFHSNNLASMRDEDFYAMEDRFLFGLDSLEDINQAKGKLTGKYKKTVAVVLIVLGVVMLWQAVFNLLFDIFGWDSFYLRTIYFFMRDDLPRFLIGIVIICIGCVMIRGKKIDSVADEEIFTRKNQTEAQEIPKMKDSREAQNVFDGQNTDSEHNGTDYSSRQ